MTLRGFTSTLMLAFGLAASAGAAAEDNFSKANTLLFLEDHLTQTDYSAKYVYSAERTGAGENDYDDSITMTARNSATGEGKNVEFSLLPKDRERPVQDVENARGNPLIMVFLQADVLDLAAATGGHWRYFQKQMKLALENDAQVEPVTVEFQGQPIAAQRITVTPYDNDEKRRDDLGRYRDKTYEFIISDQVPGKVFELRSEVPAEAGTETGAPLIERVTLKTVEKIAGQS